MPVIDIKKQLQKIYSINYYQKNKHNIKKINKLKQYNVSYYQRNKEKLKYNQKLYRYKIYLKEQKAKNQTINKSLPIFPVIILPESDIIIYKAITLTF